ncbi:hypothetical protein FRB96_005409 [Tulasnella sp. 330]|nr:hypothetical protein FRB96_005409 [Tulasnella sp. 330]KAG8883000.1 hypothetical protein FRB97_007373 [Tulasnella sp. 331]KAG8888495.1 hypothetical protein FRB98_007535 [Tulasnella sp. 332]
MSTLTLPKDFLIGDSTNSGKFTLNQLDAPNQLIYTLSLNSPPENRITPTFVTTLLEVLDVVEHSIPHSAVLVSTSSIVKFYSNGFLLEAVGMDVCPQFPTYWHKLLIRLLTLPIPTVAYMNGHTFAAGFMLAMFHDYRVMSPSRCWCCLNEIDLGMELHPSICAIFRAKLEARTYRTVILEGKRFTALEAHQSGIVDAVGDMPEVMKLVRERNLIGKGSKNVYGLLRDEMHRETIALLEKYPKYTGLQRDDNEKEGLPRWSKL